MFLLRALSRLCRAQSVRRQASSQRRSPYRLLIERLEDRLCPSSAKYVYIASFGTNTVERYQEGRWAPAPAYGQTGATFVAPNSGGLSHPLGVVIGPYDHDLYITSLDTNEVLRYHGTTGEFLGAFVHAGDGGLLNPSGMLFGPDGNLYVSSTGTDKVLRYNGHTGQFIVEYLTLDMMGGVTGITFGPDGAFYASTRFDNSIVRYDGTSLTTFVAPGSGGLSRAGGPIFGPDGNLYVTSESTANVLRFDGATGNFIDEFVHAGSGGLARPAGLLFGKYGDLYVNSVGTNSILHYDGQSGAFINAIITRHDDQVLSGPRGLFFTETNPTTFAYQPHHHPSPTAAPGDPHGRLVEVAGILALANQRANPIPLTPALGTSFIGDRSTDPTGDVVHHTQALPSSADSTLPLTLTTAQSRDLLFAATGGISALTEPWSVVAVDWRA